MLQLTELVGILFVELDNQSMKFLFQTLPYLEHIPSKKHYRYLWILTNLSNKCREDDHNICNRSIEDVSTFTIKYLDSTKSPQFPKSNVVADILNISELEWNIMEKPSS